MSWQRVKGIYSGAMRAKNNIDLNTGYMLPQGNGFGIEFWANFSVIDNQMWFADNHNTTADGFRFAIFNNKLGGTSYGVEDAYITWAIPLNQWDYYKIDVRADNRLYLTVNGAEIGSVNFGVMNLTGSLPVTILKTGLAADGANKFSNVKFTVGGATAFYYKINEESGNTIYDSSTNNLHLTSSQINASRIIGRTITN